MLRTKLTADSCFDKHEEHFLVWKHQVPAIETSFLRVISQFGISPGNLGGSFGILGVILNISLFGTTETYSVPVCRKLNE